SAGHDAEVPVQVSALSHSPADPRQVVPAATRQVLFCSSQTFPQTPPFVHGSPGCVHSPASHSSAPLQNTPSSQAIVLFGKTQPKSSASALVGSQTLSVHALLS